MKLGGKAESLKHRLAEAEENLRLIQERKSEYVQAADIPLQLIKDERRLVQTIDALRAQLEQLPPPQEGEPPIPTRPRARTIAAGIAGLALVLAVGAAALGVLLPQGPTTTEPSSSTALSLEQVGDPLYPGCNVRAITQTPNGMLAALDSCKEAGVKRVGGSGPGADPGNPDGLLTSPLAVVEQTDGRLLAGAVGSGLVELESDGTVTRVHTQTADGAKIAAVGSVVPDGAGGVWVGSSWEPGLHLLDDQGEWRTLPWEDEKFAVYDIELDEIGQVWIATFGGGARCLDSATRTWTAVYNQRTCPGCLPSDAVFDIIVADGRKWVGTDNGLAVLDDRGEQPVWQVVENLPYSGVVALAKDDKGHVFVGLEEGLDIDKGGLAIVDEKLKVIKALTLDYSISALAFDPQQSQLWVGTLGKGLSVWSVRDQEGPME
jgi:hypothetical protein